MGLVEVYASIEVDVVYDIIINKEVNINYDNRS
jgi:hypothetical protein